MHSIVLRGARTHNLKSVDLELAPGQLVALTGPSGAGKSSLALDTLYSEGQRRFVESFSPYARQFLERLERPPVDSLEPIAAAVAVDRRAPVKSSRSTLATMADLEPYLGALFTRESVPVCDACGVAAQRTDAHRAADRVIAELGDVPAIVTYRLPIADTEQYLEVRESLLQTGYRRLWVEGEVVDLDELAPSRALASGDGARVVVDRLALRRDARERLVAAVEQAWQHGGGDADIHLRGDAATALSLAEGLSCPQCARRFEAPRAGLFSYQSPLGACPTCRGFGRVIGIDYQKVIPDDSLSLAGGAIRPWTGKKSAWERRVLRKYCEREGIPMDRPYAELSGAQREMVLAGEGSWRGGRYPGVRKWFAWLTSRTYKMHVRVLLARYRSYDRCETCQGQRLSRESLRYRVGGLDLAAWHALELGETRLRLEEVETATAQGEIARAELVSRLRYLERVGLSYLTLDRQARTLSGGEAQRVSLTAALGTSLTGGLFVLDEPTVGLHQADIEPLVGAMRQLSDRGNAVVVVEHDPAVVQRCDRAVELGPEAGSRGGEVVFDGTPAALVRRRDLPTGRTFQARLRDATPPERRQPTGQLRITGARENNLRDVDVHIPLGVFVAITGPSGSGKSTLAHDILFRAAARAVGDRDVELPGEHDGIEGLEQLESVALLDQAPLGRTSRGNPATYTGAYNRIRAMFAALPDAKARGLTPGHFSFNVAAGRCEACAGEGSETIEMQFLADVSLTCPSCRGRRFKQDVLDVELEGRSIADVLACSVDEALALFARQPAVVRALSPLQRLGLGYLALGQPLSTLSGGEAQRLKLARTLAAAKPKTLVVLDEPSAGLHAEEIALLNATLDALVRAGGSVVVVEHDLDVVAAADWVIELGPGAGSRGGTVCVTGTPERVAESDAPTGRALRRRAEPTRKRGRAEAKTERAEPPTGPVGIEVLHAREHNLKEVQTTIPHGCITVVTGPSGSGKSTLAFDVVFAEGQRRFLETLTPYARQFLPTLPRPDVDRVTGVPPSIALEQRSTRSGSSSTVATVTEIAHYLRLLYAKVGEPRCPSCDCPVVTQTADEAFASVHGARGSGLLLAPTVVARKGSYLDVFTAAARAGCVHAIADGKLCSTDRPPRLNKRREHSIDIVVFEGRYARIDRATFDRALAFGHGDVKLRAGSVEDLRDATSADELLVSTARVCRRCGISVPELDPRWFSFNTKQGRCELCEGAGTLGGDEQAVLEGADAEPCPECEGARLSPLPRAVRLAGDRYHRAVARSVADAAAWAKGLTFDGVAARIAEAPHRELCRRLDFVVDVGLGYLGLDRRAATLSGGEMQRLRLAAQLGSGLTGALYVLDEPTIGLHPRDTGRLLQNLRRLADMGSTVLMVEHDADTIRAADHLVDLGPRGGRGGGHIVAEGAPSEVLSRRDSPTARALADERRIATARAARPAADEWIELTGAREHNLRIDTVRIPVGRLTVVAGVSGSGKSTLVQKILYPAVRRALKLATPRPGAHDRVRVPRSVTRAVAVDQSPIGRTPRSVPATFLGVWDEVRKVFAKTPEAKVRGFGPARFSFNTPRGGRCSECDGQGVIAHEMSFLPDAVTPCSACGGTRFEPSTLGVRYLDLDIGQVLALSAGAASEVFATHRRIRGPLAAMDALGVGYLQIGQGSHTLSGGEAQRLKLAAELEATLRPKPTLYVLDEPTTGLHLADVEKLIAVFEQLVQRGDTVVVIEHHPAVIACADWVVELGPEGGEGGGRVVAEGEPASVAAKRTATAAVLRSLGLSSPRGASKAKRSSPRRA